MAIGYGRQCSWPSSGSDGGYDRPGAVAMANQHRGTWWLSQTGAYRRTAGKLIGTRLFGYQDSTAARLPNGEETHSQVQTKHDG